MKIARIGKEKLLNNKNEFGCNNLPELQLKYGNERGASPDAEENQEEAIKQLTRKEKQLQNP